jgi:glycyl-tRNA synthetase beta chain
VPQECLILTMKANQKYFPLLDAAGKLTNKFLVVSNISPADASAVIGGNERVVRPRLADAKFFFDQDRKKSLESRVVGLAKVVYHNKLGTQGERVQRVAAIARAIAEQLGGGAVQHAEQAAVLAKADLLTDMVGEFPELQGIMGRYYAQHDGLNATSPTPSRTTTSRALPATACRAAASAPSSRWPTSWKPWSACSASARFRPATGPVRAAPPCAGRDPHAGRGQPRPAAGGHAGRGWRQVLDGRGLQAGDRATGDFIYDRLAGSLREHGYTAQEVDAVVSQRPQRLGDIPKRLAAVRAFAALPEAAALAAANKRVGNILKKVEDPVEPRSIARCSRKPPKSRCTTRWSRSCRRPMPPSSPATTPSRCSPGRLARRSMPSSTASWSMPTTRPCAPTASACSPSCIGDEPGRRHFQAVR